MNKKNSFCQFVRQIALLCISLMTEELKIFTQVHQHLEFPLITILLTSIHLSIRNFEFILLLCISSPFLKSLSVIGCNCLSQFVGFKIGCVFSMQRSVIYGHGYLRGLEIRGPPTILYFSVHSKFSSMSIFPDYQYAAAAKSLQSCLTLCDPKDCSLPGSSVHGIFQARVLEWGAVAFSL